ncbi:MAG: hypothetical protein PHD04_00900 [Candidatus Pacebacteria bacterium]|nr:hypothetical protein [Candidatus Paceibacterota bacterium]
MSGLGNAVKTVIQPLTELETFYNPVKSKLINPIEGLKGIQDVATDLFPVPELPPVNAPASFKDNNTALQNASKLEAERLRKRKGMKATILTQDSSLMTPAVQTQKAELLG